MEKRFVELANLETRESANEDPVIEGYFAVFNSDYIWGDGMSESISPGAFTSSLSNDIRALINHDSSLVLGRTSAHTFEVREDAHGLWGRLTVNPKDRSAMDLYERVKRGDVTGCSIGFNIREQDTSISENGSVHWTIKDVDLLECSVCTFPAYEETNVSARSKDRDEALQAREEEQKREAEQRAQELATWREQMQQRLKGENNA